MIGWFTGCVLRYINPCRLFNDRYFLYIYIKYIWFGLVVFYVISTIEDYLMPNRFHTYTWDIYMIWFGWVLWYINHCRLFNAKSSLYIYIKYLICTHIFLITFLNKPEGFFCTQFCYLMWRILFTIDDLFAHS